jgi:hypothetical protein
LSLTVEPVAVSLPPEDQIYGVLTTGFTRMRMPEIRQEIIAELQRRTGLVFETRPDSITGQFIDTFSEREAILWELAEAVYHAMYPISAFGSNLDYSVSFAGVRRLFERRSTVWAILYGNENTIVAPGALVRQDQSQDNFLLTGSVTISRNNATDITVEISTAVEGQNYWIQINTVTYNYVAGPADTPLDVAAGLAVNLLAARLEIFTDANTLRIWTVEFVPFTVMTSPNVMIISIGSAGNFQAQEFGTILVPVNTLTQIVTTTNGWLAVNNIVPGQLGRNLETDDELRLRYNLGVFRLGAATLPAIRANLIENVPGILALNVFENVEDFIDDEGRPPHSIEVVVYGGAPEVIAEQILLLKAAGIDTHGDIEIQVLDPYGFHHPIKFNRPTSIPIWLNVEVFLYNQEAFPLNGAALIQEIVVATGDSFGIGVDVIMQRFIGPIYRNVSGISRLEITMAKTIESIEETIEPGERLPEPDEFSEDNIVISSREVSRFDLSRVHVYVHYIGIEGLESNGEIL